ncbi:phosphatidylinositol N-acetylglucosaminyltransferase subunit P-like [Penaeus monodon]|uniref:Phosphatidylinositol N-acetylglucosaminyltransferase subunit P n=1 Tax=Penaeus vannamei TaxID=6689 RepID=A0A423SGN8_PENVA|nr:phosphatidylinositol N-acetylglucosaminyltransferase subunit P-like [Penaeus vannamei]XP_037773366.1 phosphatidylinositol N-acetylglucosaminyltransferase subunit P-like [Penaeus monodon]ROT63376.1 Phosphatidylinositol N-acetylglucosaminyltransferase subunit P [Penaeus vannamei]
MGEHTPAPSPGRSYYGFVLYLLGWAGIISYLAWALIPHSYLAALGLTYIPQPYWALAFPSVIITLVLIFVFFIYPSLNLILALPPHDIRNITDNMAMREEDYPRVEEYGVPPVCDLPISQVCRALYR